MEVLRQINVLFANKKNCKIYMKPSIINDFVIHIFHNQIYSFVCNAAFIYGFVYLLISRGHDKTNPKRLELSFLIFQ